MSEHNTPHPGILSSLTAAAAESLKKNPVPEKLGRQYRKMEITGYDPDTRTVSMTMSSETPVDRWYGSEVLSHQKGAIRLDRLKNGIALLFNHDYDKHLGVSESYEIADKALRVKHRFGDNPLALEKEKDVASKILKDTSIGYLVHEWEITEDKNGNRTYLAVDWEPLEDSLVTVPADPSVGVGRDAKDVKDAVPVKVRSFRKLEEDDPDDPDETGDEDDDDDEDDDPEERTIAPQDPAPQTPTQRTKPTMADEIKDNAAVEQERVKGLRQLRTQYKDSFSEDQLLDAISKGTAVDAAKTGIADRILAKASSADNPSIAEQVVGTMSERELAAYSLRNVYAAAVDAFKPGTFSDKASGLAREVSDEIRKKAAENGVRGLGNGILMPGLTSRTLQRQRQLQQRALTAGGNVGTYTGFTEVAADPIELLRSRTVCLALGARYMSGLHGNIQLPRQNAAASSSWLAESASVSNSDPTLNDITLTPHRLSIMNSYTRDLLAISNLSIDSFLAEDRLAVLARSLDVAGLNGSGSSNVPLGLLNQSGLAAVLAGTTRASNGTVTAGAGGVPLTYVDLNNMEAAISTANGDVGTMGWALRPKVRAGLRSTPQIPGTASGFCFPNSKVGANGVQEGPLGYNTIASTQVPTGYTANSVSNLDAVILGVWDQMLFGDWDLHEVIVDNVTGAAGATYKIYEHGYYDTNVRHIEAFCACTSALPS